MNVKTRVKSGGMPENHGVRVKTRIRAGGMPQNHRVAVR
jgi:acid phosphatase family membrane protein YuiD